jgi:hypothetical protein
MNGSLRIIPSESISLSASPAERQELEVMHLITRILLHLDWLMYSCSIAACHTQNTNSSSTPLAARNSNVYSIIGTFTRGSNTLGCECVRGRKHLEKESAKRMACNFASLLVSSVPALAIEDFLLLLWEDFFSFKPIVNCACKDRQILLVIEVFRF